MLSVDYVKCGVQIRCDVKGFRLYDMWRLDISTSRLDFSTSYFLCPHGVATISGFLKIIGRFCRISSLL